ncbi:MAG TPA: TonB-dependent receptor [bacterium]|nr:TonB-dependent receptor [bacterium]HNB57044.1 TonB-dependent receptor [bacterium]HNO91020.1 TonB-dependent receptor [bacterium]
MNKMLVKNLFFLALFVTVAVVNSQETGVITGVVIDAKTKEYLAGVNVQILGTTRGTVADINGQYRLDKLADGTYRLQFSLIGYAPLIKTDVIVTGNKPFRLNVAMEAESIEGDEVIVTAGYFEEQYQTKTSTANLSREEIRRFPGGFEDVVQTVATLPGVAVNGGGGRNDLLVRGGGPSENLYIVNGLEIPNINHFGTQGNNGGSLSFINLDFVDNVDFSTGGFSARYGDKMSSVTQLTLRSGRDDRIGGKGLVSATQFGVNTEGPLGKRGNFIMSARRSYLDFIFKAAGFAFVPRYTDFNMIGQYEPSPRDKFTFLALTALDDVSKNNEKRKDRIFNSGLLDNEQFIQVVGAGYQHNLEKGFWQVTANVNFSGYRFSQKDTTLREYYNSRANEVETNASVQRYFVINKSMGILTGLSMKFVNNRNETVFGDTIVDRNGNRIPADSLGLAGLDETRASAYKYGGFTEMDWVVSPRLNANAGLRVDRYSALKKTTYVAPRLAFKYKISDKSNLKLSGGTYYQSPSYVWLVNPANKKLKALRNDMVVAGADRLLRPDVKLSIETYYKKYSHLPTGTQKGINDYIVITSTGTGFGGREDNFQSFGYATLVSRATGKAFGVEMLLQKKFSDIPCYGQVSITVGKSTVVAGNGKTYPNPFDQRFILNISGGYKLNTKWEFSGKFRYFTGAPYTPVYRPQDNPVQPGVVQNLPDEYLSKRLGASHHLDLRADRYFNYEHWRLIIFMDVQNVYNYKVKTPPSYDFAEDKVTRGDRIGILPTIGISAEF